MRALLFGAVVAVAIGLGSGCTPECPNDGGTGDVVVVYEGLPAGVGGPVMLTGPSNESVTAAQTLTGKGTGSWTVTAGKATESDPRVRSAYAATVSPASFCLSRGTSQTVTVTWSLIPTSHKLWWTNGTGGTGSLLGYSPAALGSTTPAATVSASAAGGKDIAFDADGNLWAFGNTTVDPAIVRYPASAMGSSGSKTADRQIDISGLDCFPRLSSLAFDPAGNLWVTSPCQNTVMKISAAALQASGTVTPAATGTGLTGAQGLAFDSAGNLWVAAPGDQRVVRFDASQLGSASLGSPTRVVRPRASDTPSDDSLLSPGPLAFDGSGSLWSNDFGANVIFRIPSAALAGTGTADVNPGVRITLSVSALLEGIAFDETGALWTAYSAGSFARLGPSQLTVSTGSGAPTVPEYIGTSADVGYAANPAFYPAPAATPLFHRLP